MDANNIQFFVGIDLSSTFFTVSFFDKKTKKVVSFENFENLDNGFKSLLSKFQSVGIKSDNAMICMEATGVYGEYLSYFLLAKDYLVVIENPLKVKRAFKIKGGNNDKISSVSIAEYAYRFKDQLERWEPKSQIIQQIQGFLTQREMFMEHKTANMNAKKALEKKHYCPRKAIELHEKAIESLEKNIKEIEEEMSKIIENDSEYKQMIANITSVNGVGKMLAYNLMVVTNGFKEKLDAKKLASYLGIAPEPYQSGTSVYRRPKSSGIGPGIFRRVLYMVSMSCIVHNKVLSDYYNQKVKQGKSKRLVINNVANKLIKILVAMIKSKKPFIEKFVSINPNFIKKS